MTDSQQLLVEYARERSETAFRELARRYIDLVYSTALRLLEGDTRRAEDVARTNPRGSKRPKWPRLRRKI